MKPTGDSALVVVPVRYVGRYIAGGAALVAIAMIVHTLLSKIPSDTAQCHISLDADGHRHRQCTWLVWRFSWDIVGRYFTSSLVLQGLAMTLLLTALTMVVGISIGVLVAIMRQSPSRVVSSVAWVYAWFFRGTPVYVQLLFWFNIAAIYPSIHFGLPFVWRWFEVDTVALMTPFVAALVGLGLNEGAYMSEIVRGGILAVDEGQIEAAASLGLTRLQTLRLVTLPQAMRVIVPPTGNEVISMLKTSSLASALSVTELLRAAQNIYSSTYEVIPLLIVASLWYLIVTTVLSIGQYYLERRFSRGSQRQSSLTPWQRFRRDAKGIAGKFRTHRGYVAQ